MSARTVVLPFDSCTDRAPKSKVTVPMKNENHDIDSINNLGINNNNNNDDNNDSNNDNNNDNNNDTNNNTNNNNSNNINNNRIANIDRNGLKSPAIQTSQINIENIENRNILSFNIPLMDMSVHGEGRTSRNHVSTAFIFDF